MIARPMMFRALYRGRGFLSQHTSFSYLAVPLPYMYKHIFLAHDLSEGSCDKGLQARHAAMAVLLVKERTAP